MSRFWLTIKTFVWGIIVAPAVLIGFISSMFYDRLWLMLAFFVAAVLMHVIYPIHKYEADLQKVFGNE